MKFLEELLVVAGGANKMNLISIENLKFNKAIQMFYGYQAIHPPVHPLSSVLCLAFPKELFRNLLTKRMAGESSMRACTTDTVTTSFPTFLRKSLRKRILISSKIFIIS